MSREKTKRAEDAKPVVEKAVAGAEAALGPGALLPKGGWRRSGTVASGGGCGAGATRG